MSTKDTFKRADFLKRAVSVIADTPVNRFLSTLKAGFMLSFCPTSDAALSTIKKHGKEKYSEVTQMRTDIHKAIKADSENLK